MNKKLRILFYISNISLPLVVGLILYLLLPGNTFISKVFDSLFLTRRLHLENQTIFIFARNHLCDAFWAYSLTFSVYTVLKNTISVSFIAISLGFILELLQLYAIIGGTFDIIDLIFELVAVFAALSIIHIFTKGELK